MVLYYFSLLPTYCYRALFFYFLNFYFLLQFLPPYIYTHARMRMCVCACYFPLALRTRNSCYWYYRYSRNLPELIIHLTRESTQRKKVTTFSMLYVPKCCKSIFFNNYLKMCTDLMNQTEILVKQREKTRFYLLVNKKKKR